MVGGILPFGQIYPGQDAGLARDTWVDLVIRQHHSVNLDR